MRRTRRLTLILTMLGLSLLFGVSEVSADPPSEFEAQAVFTDTNPCTGEPHLVTINLAIREHRDHERVVTGIADRSGFTDSGFVMEAGTSHFVDNARVFRRTLSDMWFHPETGERFHASVAVVVNKNTGRTQVDMFMLRCLGDATVDSMDA